MTTRSLSIILLIAFIGIGVFGFLGIGHTTACLARLSERPSCSPQHTNANDLSLFHVNAFQKFSQAILSFAVALFLVLFAIIIASRAWSSKRQVPKFFSIVLDLSNALSRSQHSSWLALFEHSPAVF